MADAYDAMTSDRVYRAALPPQVALAELRKGIGTQFDPQIVELFHEAYLRGMLVPGVETAIAAMAEPSRANLWHAARNLRLPILARRRVVHAEAGDSGLPTRVLTDEPGSETSAPEREVALAG